MFFLLPLAPEALLAATALASSLCMLVTRVGLIYGPRIMELADAIFCEGAAGAAMGAQSVRLAPQVIDRLAQEFADIPNTRNVILLTQQAMERVLSGPHRLYGKEVEAVLDYCEQHCFDYTKIGKGMHDAAEHPIRWVGERPPKQLPGVKVKPPTHGGQVQLNRLAQLAYWRELLKSRRGAQPPYFGF